ncbi:hypothetical protein ACFQ4Q_10200 [Lysobacter gummosus]|uniref:hypothetical protein n=1 Tax=Lysobacter gummosus TaxID=262324 RepID=UPI003644B508
MGSIRPYYRRHRPIPQHEADFLRPFGLRWPIDRLRTWGLLPLSYPVHVRALAKRFPSDVPGAISIRELLGKMLRRGGIAPYVNLRPARLVPSADADALAEVDRLYETRAAAAVFSAVSPHLGVHLHPKIQWLPFPAPAGALWPFRVNDMTGEVDPFPDHELFSSRELLELKFYGDAAPTVYHPTFKSLAAMAYADYFPGPRGEDLRGLVAQAILASAPGWCGTFGPGTGTFKLISGPLEGNYDMAQQHLLRTAYAYFDELPSDARKHLIGSLLARGRIARVNLNDTFTSARVPNDWARAGKVSPLGMHKRIGETENHILMIATARYLNNQLLYQRSPSILFDNRRNGTDDAPSCLDQILYLLRNILRDDFSEYNAKNYQHETRTALLNLYSFSYDAEVRLGARMVLDYISAHMAASSGDCRRMVPFRRRNEGKNVSRAEDGSMTTSLLDLPGGADPMTEHMAMQSGAVQVYGVPAEPWRALDWSIASDGGYSTYEMLSDYRMPMLIQDLFVTDLHRRFFQALYHRTLDDPEMTGRNSSTRELTAGSASYLLTAGGQPARYAIDPYFWVFVMGNQDQQLGVAVPSSFMPKSGAAENSSGAAPMSSGGLQSWAADLIQIGHFAQEGQVQNYGVAPDLLFGPYLHLPNWCTQAIRSEHRMGRFDFVDKRGAEGGPGFYLAILRDGDLAIVEAFDTWLDPNVSFDGFRASVWQHNQDLSDSGLRNLEEIVYVTQAGHRVKLLMYAVEDGSGAYPLDIIYGSKYPTDVLPEAGGEENFLRGTILNGPGDGFVRIDNRFLGQWIELDMKDPRRPRRRAESGAIQAAGDGQEVWVDFEWGADAPRSEGDFYRPFQTFAEGKAALAHGGTIRIVPGSSAERGNLSLGKRMRIIAPIGNVRIGSRAA